MFCRLTISRFVRLWPLFPRRGKEARPLALTQNSGVWPLAPGWASTELMKLSSEQSDINMDTQPFLVFYVFFFFFFNHVELERLILGGL